ncbi:MAG TPA: phosphoribosylamine--glycine ligase [Thermoplasmatales archaeon]|nr:phosphoribosylamine--glycine ligase [Thermoplasmatales archaeon]
MKVMVVGGGAREHAICDAVARSENVELYAFMHNRNPGIIRLAKNVKIEKETNIDSVVDFAVKNDIELAVIGPEAPLQVGVTDALLDRGVKVCSPTQAAARVETDKEWMRNLMKRYRIPGQLRYKTFTDVEKAKGFIEQLEGEVAVKPIGLTGGKGVKIVGDHLSGIADAVEYAKEVIEKGIGGENKVLIEEKVVGEEFTLQAFSDGETIFPMPAVQDHKRLLPGDKGPNTGGMGSYSDKNGLLPFLGKSDYEESTLILQKIVEALSREGCPFVGPIYGQFMLTVDGPRIIEVNARFGDPEAMNVLPLLQDDFVDICLSMLEGSLNKKRIRFQKKATVCKYVVPEGYGIESMVHQPISVDEDAVRDTGALLFYASVNKEDETIYTTSSRSLAVVGIGNSISEAEQICEKGLDHVKGDHIFIRHDIGTKELIEKRIAHMRQLCG